jgi:antitoxin (DNA-binding transcriptional repressor) of toxin-antitoxin stability system
MQTDIRHLKSNLTRFVHQAAEGENIIIEIEGQAVAQIVAAGPAADPRNLPGISWNGQKPRGIDTPETLLDHSSLSDRVIEDRG